MARGQVLQIASGTNQTVSTQSREEKSSFVVYNPNDGVCYFKLNGAASTQAGGYDWKLPGQSAGSFGGPWQSLGIFFLDQSGAGRTGEINLFDADNEVQIPNIWAIGRSLQAQVTTLDITEGVQPPNPPVGVNRIWSDSNGKLYALLSDGTLLGIPEQIGGLGGMLQLTTLNGVPASGSGLELFGYAATPSGVVQAVNRGGGGTYIELDIRGNSIKLNPGGEGSILFGANGVPFPASVLFAVLASNVSCPATTVTTILSLTVPPGLYICQAQVTLSSGVTGQGEVRLQDSPQGGLEASGEVSLSGSYGTVTLATLFPGPGSTPYVANSTLSLTVYPSVAMTALSNSSVSNARAATQLTLARIG